MPRAGFLKAATYREEMAAAEALDDELDGAMFLRSSLRDQSDDVFREHAERGTEYLLNL